MLKETCYCPPPNWMGSSSRNGCPPIITGDAGWQYQFGRATGAACPLLARCRARLPQHNGRVVVKNDSQAEYAAARQKAQTPEYAKVRQHHPAIERKLAERVRVQRMRWAR